MEIKLIVPIEICFGRKKYSLSLNNYRNWHFIANNKIKQEFGDLIFYELREVKNLIQKSGYTKIKSMEYQLIFKDKRRRDKMNFISIVDKFFLDCLVKQGIIEDDNDDFIGKTIIHKPKTEKGRHECEVLIDFSK